MIQTVVIGECCIYDLYGPAEATIGCTLFLTNKYHKNMSDVPIGNPMVNYYGRVLDEFDQEVIVGQDGQLIVGGVGVFAGYLKRDELTAKAIVQIDKEQFYRTGDLVRIGSDGLLHYRGRKDHQIKLHGQRIELGEIERCLLKYTSISACVVMKSNENHLIAYVESFDVDKDTLRKHCESQLPSYMVPSMFMILEKFPLNSNGKIDRKLLPISKLSYPLTTSSENKFNMGTNQLDAMIEDVWCEVLQCVGHQIPQNANFFSIGGHSLLFIQLYHRYQTLFGFESNMLSITMCLEKPTIEEHKELLEKVVNTNMKLTKWHTLHLVEGKQIE